MVRDLCTNVFWITVAVQPGLNKSGTAVTDRAVLPQGGSSKWSLYGPSAHPLSKRRDISHIHAKLDVHPERAVVYFTAFTVQSGILPPLGALGGFLTYNFKAG